MEKTRYLVLRHIPFQESGRIVAGISPEKGRLDFLVKGDRASGPKKFPAFGLFRELLVEYNPPRRSGSLASPRSYEICGVFDGVANDVKGYLAACGYASLLLNICRESLECPGIYAASILLLKRLSGRTMDVSRAVTLAHLAILKESGLMPETPGRAGELITSLTQAGFEDIPLPDVTDAYMLRVSDWCSALMKRGGLTAGKH